MGTSEPLCVLLESGRARPLRRSCALQTTWGPGSRTGAFAVLLRGLSTGTARLADNALRVSRWRARRFRTRSPYILWRSVHLGPEPLCFATRLRTSVALTEGWVGMWPSLSPQLPQTKRPTPFCPRFFHSVYSSWITCKAAVARVPTSIQGPS